MKIIFLACSLLFVSHAINCAQDSIDQEQNVAAVLPTDTSTTTIATTDPADQKQTIAPAPPKAPQKKNFLFQFENKDLVDVINLIAAEKGVNVVLPQKPAIIDTKLTFHVDGKMTIDKAWNLLYTVLDVAGYTIKPQGDMFAIIRIPDQAKDITAEPMPTFIGTPFNDLPDGDVRIRYVHYLTNMKVPAASSGGQDNELVAVLTHIFAGNPVNAAFFFDFNANALIVAGKASSIKSALSIVTQLDKGGFHEKMEIVKLKHSTASVVRQLFVDGLLKTIPTPAGPMRNDGRKQNDAYFAPNTRIIDEPRTNSLIVVGRSQAVDRIKDFIETYIDIEPDSGRSVLHVYSLLYLDAQNMVSVLNNMLTGAGGGTNQSTTDGKPVGGPERFFDQVIITSDRPINYQAQNADDKGSSAYQYSGGNRLIVAARNDDWKRIKNLLEQLDKPFPQVFIEVLIADVNLDDIRQLGTQTRNLNGCLPSQVNIQAAELNKPVVDTTVPPGTIAGDLLSPYLPITNSSGTITGYNTLAGVAPAGSTLISFNKDGETWSLLQLLRKYSSTKIISHPHVVARDNKKASISTGATRLVLGEAALGATAATIKQDQIKAMLMVDLTPRISPDNIINLNVDITINTFAADTATFGQNTILVREVHTNANVRNKSILALGGLVTTERDDAENATPLLSRIPIIGWFFKNRRAEATKGNLTVFISPTVIMPNLRGGIHRHAQDYIGLAKEYALEGSLFDSLRDPVTRFYFKTGTVEAAAAIDEFVKDDDSLSGNTPRTKAPGRKLNKRRAKKNILAAANEKPESRMQLKDVIGADEKNPLLASTRAPKSAAAA